MAGHARARGGRPDGRSAYLDQLLGGQPRAGGWRRRGLRRRVVVRVFQIVSGEERRVAGRVRSAQHRLELREHWLVLRGRRLGHGSQAGTHGQHPRGHGRSGGGATGAGHGAIAIPTSPGLARDGGLGAGAAAGDPWAGGQRLTKAGTQMGLLGSATRHRRGPPAATFSRTAPELSRSARNPLPPPPSSTSKLRARVPAPRLLTLDARLYFTQLRGGRTSSRDWQRRGQ